MTNISYTVPDQPFAQTMGHDIMPTNSEPVAGMIKYLPRKDMISADDMPDLDDGIFDHPVLIIFVSEASDHCKQQNRTVRFLVVSHYFYLLFPVQSYVYLHCIDRGDFLPSPFLQNILLSLSCRSVNHIP